MKPDGSLSDGYYKRKSEKYINGDFHYTNRLKIILSMLGPYKGQHILDIGCGFGSCSIECAKKGCVVTSVDIAEMAIKTLNDLAKRFKLKINAVRSSCTSMPKLKSGSFDAIVAADILEHLTPEDTKKTLKECNRLLKKGGKLIIYTPNARHFTEYVRLEKVEGHIGLKTMGYFKKVLPETGFKIEKAFFKPSSVSVVRQMDMALGWLIPFFRKRICIVARKKSDI